MATRAKFRVNRLTKQKYTNKDGSIEISSVEVMMNPVYSSDSNSENHAYWKSSPSGTLSLWITNPNAYKQFEEGQEYYLDFTLAE